MVTFYSFCITCFLASYFNSVYFLLVIYKLHIFNVYLLQLFWNVDFGQLYYILFVCFLHPLIALLPVHCIMDGQQLPLNLPMFCYYAFIMLRVFDLLVLFSFLVCFRGDIHQSNYVVDAFALDYHILSLFFLLLNMILVLRQHNRTFLR